MANESRRQPRAWESPPAGNRHHEQRRRQERERRREETLGDWYGGEYAETEIEAHQPGEHRLGDLLANAFAQMNAGDYPLMRRIIENWRQIMGAEFMQHAEPRRIDRGVLYVEVFQAAWLHRLRLFALPLIRQRLHELTDGKIRDVRLVPGGATPRRQ